MKTQFNNKHLTLAILSVLLPAANVNAVETAGVSVGSAIGLGPKAHTTQLVRVNSSGTASGNGNSSPSALSADGRFIAFNSGASDLVANDTNNLFDVFVRPIGR